MKRADDGAVTCIWSGPSMVTEGLGGDVLRLCFVVTLGFGSGLQADVDSRAEVVDFVDYLDLRRTDYLRTVSAVSEVRPSSIVQR